LLSFLFVANLFADDSAKDKSEIIQIDEPDYAKTIEEGIVLVDFWAAWCPPCRRMNPILEELAKEHKGKVKIAKLNVDKNKKFATSKKINAIPVIIAYKDGKEVQRIVGQVPKSDLEAVIKGLMEK